LIGQARIHEVGDFDQEHVIVWIQHESGAGTSATGLRIMQAGYWICGIAPIAAVTVVAARPDKAGVGGRGDPGDAAGKTAIAERLDLSVPIPGVAAVVGDHRRAAGRRWDVVAAGDAGARAAVERVQRQPNFDRHCVVFVGA
jgi:hypothetical protein